MPNKEKNSRLIELFVSRFGDGDWPNDGKVKECKFKCTKSDECNVREGSPKYTGILGSNDTDIMIIAEAPSASGGSKAYFGGNVETLFEKDQKSDTLQNIIRYIKANNPSPYFTDVIKCGVPKQSNKKTLNAKRRNNCIKEFLIEEIKIINPKVIFCVGNMAFNVIRKLIKEKKVSEKTKIIKLIHYSRQANLPLTDSDKNEIWKIQSGDIKIEDFDRTVLNLDIIKTLKTNLQDMLKR